MHPMRTGTAGIVDSREILKSRDAVLDVMDE